MPGSTASSEMAALDELLLRNETNPRSRSSSVGIEILDRAPDWSRLVEAFERASRVVVRLRQRVVVPTVSMAPARWVTDPDFELNYHLRHVAMPAPGDLRQVLDYALRMSESPVDLGRPLWEVTLIDGLADGRSALLTKMSHAVTDGLGGMLLQQEIYDSERDAPGRPMPPLPISEDLTPAEASRASFRGLPTVIGRLATTAVSLAARTVQEPGSSAAGLASYARSASRVLAPPPAEPSPLLRGRSHASRLEVHDVPVERLRAAAKPLGCSVNDAFVAAICGMLRRYHEAMGVPVGNLPIAIPISLRTADDPAAGNRFAGARLAAPVGEPDPAERMRVIREQVLAARSEPALAVLDLAAPVIRLLPASMLQAMNGLGSSIDAQLSNVPGDPNSRYIAGSLVERVCPCGPLPDVPMMGVLLSYAGSAWIGVRYDPAAITDEALFARCLREGFDEVLDLAAVPVSEEGTDG